jgi:hypothetical protein
MYLGTEVNTCINFGKTSVWATFWAIFFKTHLVVLLQVYVLHQVMPLTTISFVTLTFFVKKPELRTKVWQRIKARLH